MNSVKSIDIGLKFHVWKLLIIKLGGNIKVWTYKKGIKFIF